MPTSCARTVVTYGCARLQLSQPNTDNLVGPTGARRAKAVPRGSAAPQILNNPGSGGSPGCLPSMIKRSETEVDPPPNESEPNTNIIIVDENEAELINNNSKASLKQSWLSAKSFWKLHLLKVHKLVDPQVCLQTQKLKIEFSAEQDNLSFTQIASTTPNLTAHFINKYFKMHDLTVSIPHVQGNFHLIIFEWSSAIFVQKAFQTNANSTPKSWGHLQTAVTKFCVSPSIGLARPRSFTTTRQERISLVLYANRALDQLLQDTSVDDNDATQLRASSLQHKKDPLSPEANETCADNNPLDEDKEFPDWPLCRKPSGFRLHVDIAILDHPPEERTTIITLPMKH
ncbi:uncharacterized protein VP01_635g1 [Puccinia sorghi]|uniref:Uncharacterized protein n=1 Tax=Puccinia sorghi TaxID=27349 RepID=A0A0L6UG39_9BASI|nr:uncharacterized protein VP01_635g1 [Puccinia sorghi]